MTSCSFSKILGASFLFLLILSCQEKPERTLMPQDLNGNHLSGAGLAMDQWMLLRSYPNGTIDLRAYTNSFKQKKLQQSSRSVAIANWEAIGPKNIGGRTLCLAFDPENDNIIYAGSAGGGLWKTTTAGTGYVGWEPVPTGFPVIGVPAIAIDPTNSDVIYIGTGEVYNYEAAAPGEVNRVTRGSYGIGILKSIDGGQSWEASLDWSLNEMTGVQKIIINPENVNTVFAATTEGLLVSHNAGSSWQLVNDLTMAVDIEMSPVDTSLILVSYGGMNSPDKGVYRSTDGGIDFNPVALVNNYTGKTLLAFSPSNANVVYASVANEFEGVGLYRSTDGGQTWGLVNTEDVPKYQGWYAHDVVVNPTDPDNILYVGVDAYRSFDGGFTLDQRSYWSAWTFGQVPVGGPEGPPEYVHADIHAVYYHPNLNNTIYLATDGGIFVSFDNGATFEGRNGSYQTQQFYANFSNSTTDPLLGIGGMQDNSTAIYTGDDAWTRVIGGDGMSTAINPDDDNIMYGTYQNLNIRRSNNGGQTFSNNVTPPGSSDQYRAFNGPYELAPSSPSTLYAGTTRIYKSNNNGDTWTTPTQDVDNENIIFQIAISPTDANELYISTAPNPYISNPTPGKVFKSTNGGLTWTTMTGLPNHTVSDITYHPDEPDQVFLTYSGFGVNHVWKTDTGGDSWYAIGEELPDVPTNAIEINTTYGMDIYVGNDLGVYWSNNGGESWDLFTDGLPEATMVMDISFSPANEKLRIATHGHGVWESELGIPIGLKKTKPDLKAAVKVKPNPVIDFAFIEFTPEEKLEKLQMELYNTDGKLLWRKSYDNIENLQEWELDMTAYPAGNYRLIFTDKFGKMNSTRIVSVK